MAALSVFAMFFVVLLFFHEPRRPATLRRLDCHGGAEFLVGGQLSAGLPVLGIALLLRIVMFWYPVAVPWWIWAGLLLLVLAGTSRFMWFLVLFTGYWVVFWQQYISLPGYIQDYINPNANIEMHSRDRRLDRHHAYPSGELSDPEAFRHFKPSSLGTSDLRFIAHSDAQADGLGRGAVVV